MLDNLFLRAAERDNPHTRIDARHPPGTAWTTGNAVRVVAHGASYFAELHQRIGAMGDGDLVLFADWRGDPDQQLTDDPGSTLSSVLVAACRRGVDVRGLLWRSHWKRLGFHAEKSRQLGDEITEAGGQCLRDMRVRAGGCHHQKLVVLRHAEHPARDVAYLGGIDLCHGRRDGPGHHGDPQPIEMPAVFGPRPPWHDVQVAVRGPAVYDVETVFRERWEDRTPLTLNPGRRLSSLVRREPLQPRPLPPQQPPPPAVDDGHEAVQVLRTYPEIAPVGFDFAPDGERSIAHANTKAVQQARRLVYLEDQYLWSEEVGRHFGEVLRANRDLRLVAVVPVHPDVDGALSLPPQLYGRKLAMDLLLDAGGDRVSIYGLTSPAGFPVYVHSKVCIVDDVWASVGSDNFNRRSWSYDSEVACAVQDTRTTDHAGRAPRDAFPLRLRRELVGEHLGIPADEVPDDPDELWDAMAAAADALDAWYAGAVDPVGRGVRPRLPRLSRLAAPRKGTAVRWRHRRPAAAGAPGVQRPPGRLRRLEPPELSRAQLRWAPRLYDVVDPDGTIGKDDRL
ncbi:MAG: phospholipase D family protein [Phycicoccus sp.]